MKLQCSVPIRTVACSSSFCGDLIFAGVVVVVFIVVVVVVVAVVVVVVVVFVVVVAVSDVGVFTFLAVVIRYFVRAGF